jgi:hypothetical protein
VPLLRQSRFHDDPEIPPSVGKSIGEVALKWRVAEIAILPEASQSVDH